MTRQSDDTWNTRLWDFTDDWRVSLYGWCCPAILLAQSILRSSDGDISFPRAIAKYALLGGCYAMPLGWILGPLPYWFSCVPCYAASSRRQLRNSMALPEEPLSDFTVHCLCHQCAACQEYRQVKGSNMEVAAGPKRATVDRTPEETMAYLRATQEQSMTRGLVDPD